MMQILGTGLSGLVGTRLVELLSADFSFTDLSFATGVDIANRDQVWQKVKESTAPWIWHLAAKADVDGCEKDKPLGAEGDAWKINVGGTKNLVEVAAEAKKRLLYISTDFVFSGEQESYSETDQPQPVNWYGQTKYEGEKLVLQDSGNLVVRIAYPYRAKNFEKKDFVHAIYDRLKSQQTVSALTDHVFTPTFIDDIALALKKVTSSDSSGIYHAVGSTSLTPYDAAVQISQLFSFPQDLIARTSIANYYKARAQRPYKLCLNNAKITGLGVRMRTFLEGLKELKVQGIS